VDIEPDYYMMNPKLLDGLVTKATKAILAVHLYGQTLPMGEIERIARRHKLVLIEDAAQALGSKDGTRPAGNMGDISCLSFDPTKVIGSFSSAGALVTDDSQISEMVQALRYHGRNPTTRRYEILGFNSQLSTEMAAMLDFKLTRLEEWIKERDHIAQIYLVGLSDVRQVNLPKICPGSTHNWHKFVLRAEHRDHLAQYLKDHGIETMIHYPKALADEPLIQSLDLEPEAVNIPVARKAALNVISLPIYPELTEAEVNYVVESIKGFYNA
jgi:dTDP-4-amino-4,6-dideoxygalactose transaminase